MASPYRSILPAHSGGQAAEPTRASSRREIEAQLRDLYIYLQTRSWNEALEILRRIRETPDPLDVVRLVKAGDLLLHKTMPDQRDNATMEPEDPCGLHSSDVQPPLFSPWTTITDFETVQNLISVFFERDQRFLMSFVDKDMFLKVMQAKPRQSQNGWFCSSLLVNAICAITALYYTSAKGVNITSRRNLGEAFFMEAKGLLELEGRKPSLSTAQALLVMYSYSCRMGRDRAGNILRALGYEMMDRMMPKIKRALSNTAHPASSRRAISRAVWGIFCFDSICSSVYLRPSLFPIPDLPLPFGLIQGAELFEDGLEAEELVLEPLDHEHRHMMLRYTYELSEISRKVLNYAGKLDDPDGIRTVSSHLPQLYHELQALRYRLPAEEGYQGEHIHEHYHLWAYYHLVALNIARLLQRSGSQLPPPLDCPTQVCICHCQCIIKHVDRYLTRYPSERQGTLIALYFAYTCAITLVDLLDISPSAVQTFSRACHIFHEATEYPMSNILLEGLVAIANQLRVQLPADTALYFNKPNMVGIDKDSIPLGFVVPIQGRMFKPLNDGAWDLESEEAEGELADVFAQQS
ncbi:hypothetical protein QQS21_008422 [Conoideocrella luteorostrata]|uniref:Xylanolytic transcriptional activator regulatory domain-containing protein n=1 Tax=Conoideocrella luteorostrata TaxID=1105319 RepID=A0AAJ0CLN4_9HYPO|nr:hypothetical protein QQS21_008422 [Conoideocrella luteorostrata]